MTREAPPEGFWDGDDVASAWAQHRRRPARTPQALAGWGRLLAAAPALAGRLPDLAPLPDLSVGSLFFSGRWRAAGNAGTPVLVKLNCTAHELFWMRALSAPGDRTAVVPALFAGGEALGRSRCVGWSPSGSPTGWSGTPDGTPAGT